MASSLRYPEPLSAKYVGSFAYRTVKDRLPVILTQVVDVLCRLRNDIPRNYGEQSKAESKEIIGELSKLRNEMQTNKAVIPLRDNREDVLIWNTYRENYINSEGTEPCWFEAPWLYVECYMYRRIREAFLLSSVLQTFDPFLPSKEDAFLGSMSAVNILGNHLLKITKDTTQQQSFIHSNFVKFIELSLWGNKCDLSLSGGADASQNQSPLDQLVELKSNILVNDTQQIWDILKRANENHPGGVILHVVLDNAAFELFTDLCLVDYLTEMGLVNTTHFFVKEMGWFVSDTLESDFEWLLNNLRSSANESLANLGAKWSANVHSNKWRIVNKQYWTLPHDFSQMKTVDPELYTTLSMAHLIIFKGDLNYRKLTGDLMWNHTELFSAALRGFEPAPLFSLRTVKADVLVGLQEGMAEKISSQHSNWLESGEFAVIQCNDSTC